MALTATLTDPDGSISNITWQWASSPNGSSNWATISGAASARYTPVDGDVGNYLRAMASYTDGHGAGKSAQAVTANPVEDAPPAAVTLAVDLQTLALGGETPQPITFSPGAELRLLLPEDEEASCAAGRVRVYRVSSGEWELLEHRCETDEEGRVWAVSTLTSFSTLSLTVDDAAYPTGSICWSVSKSNILSWTTSKTSGSQAAANTLLVWLEDVLRLWLSLSCR